jgi:hypothetical protein
MRFSSFLSYLLLLVPSLIFVAALWTFAVAGRLYYCWDSVPLLDFVPPFVHLATDSRDHYIAPAALVWTLWCIFILFGFALPLILRRLFARR